MLISAADYRAVVRAFRCAAERRSNIDSVTCDTGDRPKLIDHAALFARCADQKCLMDPFYRVALVAEMREQVLSGTYHVAGDRIVDMLFARLFAQALPR